MFQCLLHNSNMYLHIRNTNDSPSYRQNQCILVFNVKKLISNSYIIQLLISIPNLIVKKHINNIKNTLLHILEILEIHILLHIKMDRPTTISVVDEF